MSANWTEVEIREVVIRPEIIQQHNVRYLLFHLIRILRLHYQLVGLALILVQQVTTGGT